jgi:hypothetical protein
VQTSEPSSDAWPRRTVWGAPRIHGELLKLGVAVSERTVSRYLANTRFAPSQSWRTFLANHFDQLAVTSAIRFGNATDEDDGIDAGGGLPGRVSTSSERSDVSEQRSLVEWSLFRQCTSVDGRIGHVHVHHERGEYRGSGRDPPEAPAIAFDAKASRQ